MFDAFTVIALLCLLQFLFNIFILWSWFKNRMRAEEFKRAVIPRSKAIAKQSIEQWIAHKTQIAQRTASLTDAQRKAYVQEKTENRFPDVDTKDVEDMVEQMSGVE